MWPGLACFAAKAHHYLMFTVVPTRNPAALPVRPQPVLLLLITVSQQQEFTFTFVKPHAILYDAIFQPVNVSL